MPDASDTPAVLRFGPFSLDIANARLLRDGQALVLVPKDFDVLCFLAQRPGRLVTKDELLDAVWQRRFVSESVLKNGISRLRAALGDDPRAPRWIETVQRRGYRFIAEPRGPVSSGAVASSTIAAAPWVERAAACAWLQRQWAAAIGGKTRLALMAGEAGIGKSCLIERFARDLSRSDAPHIAFGQCVEHTAGVEPYLPLLEALNALCRDAPDAGLVGLMRQVAPSWLLQLPWLLAPEQRQALQSEAAGTSPERMLREVGEFLDRATALRPLLVVIEDLHWSDAATLQLIGFLARRRSPARLLVLASLRPAEVIAGDHPLKALRVALREQRLCEEFELEPFSELDTALLLQQRAPDTAWSETAVRRLHEQTGGLPLFLSAVADDLRVGLVVDASIADIPRSLFSLIQRQRERLPEATQRRLEAAAVAGVEFIHAPLADALDVDADTLQSTFDTLVRQRTWLREGEPSVLPDGRVGVRYVFTHAVYRHVLYELTGAAARVQWHRRLAAALLRAHGARVEDVAAEVAVHFEKGQDAAQAVRYLALAAQRALQRFAAAEAASIAQRALALLDTLPDRTALRDVEVALDVVIGVALGVIEGAASPASSRAFGSTLRLMGGLQATSARVPAMHGIWWSTFVRGDITSARGMAAHALALAEERGDVALRFAGNSAMGITLVHVGEFGAAQTHLESALSERSCLGSDAAAALFSIDPEVQLAGALATSLWWQGQGAEADVRSRQALTRAEALKHPTSLLLALEHAALLHGFGGDFEAAGRLSERALALAAQRHLEREAGTSLWICGRSLVARGQIDAGLARMREGKAIQERQGLLYGLTRWYEWFAQACLAAGLPDDAARAVSDGLAQTERSGEGFATSALRALEAQLHQGRDKPQPRDA